MKHEQISARDSYAKVDIAAVWPVGGQVVPVPVLDVEQKEREFFAPTPAAPDVAAGVGKLIMLSYAGLLATFALATVASAHSVFMVTICALFLVAFFTVPILFLRQEPGSGGRPSFERFMSEGMDTMTGHSSGSAALVQMLIVPVFLTLGVIAMGIAAAIYL